MFKLKLSKSVNLIGIRMIFDSCLGSSLSNHIAKPKNEFAAMRNQWRKGVGFVTNIFRKIFIVAGAEKSMFFLFGKLAFFFRLPALTGAARVLYMIRKAVLPESNTVPGLICAVRG